MNTGNDNVHFGEDGIREVEFPVGENVNFDAGVDGDALDLVAGRADALDVRQGAFMIETSGEGPVSAMVCDGNVVIPARLCCFWQLLCGVAAIILSCMP